MPSHCRRAVGGRVVAAAAVVDVRRVSPDRAVVAADSEVAKIGAVAAVGRHAVAMAGVPHGAARLLGRASPSILNDLAMDAR